MTTRVYYATCTIRETSTAQVVHVDSDWGLKPGDFVNIILWDIDNPKHKIVVTKRLSRRGNGVGFFCSRKWGFKTGDVVVYRMRRMDDPDTGGETEEVYP